MKSDPRFLCIHVFYFSPKWRGRELCRLLLNIVSFMLWVLITTSCFWCWDTARKTYLRKVGPVSHNILISDWWAVKPHLGSTEESLETRIGFARALLYYTYSVIISSNLPTATTLEVEQRNFLTNHHPYGALSAIARREVMLYLAYIDNRPIIIGCSFIAVIDFGTSGRYRALSLSYSCKRIYFVFYLACLL